MQIQITGRHLSVTDAMKSYVEEKIGKLSNHFDHIIGAHVIMSVERERHLAEAKIEVPGNDIIAHADGASMYEAIDLLEAKLDRQVRKRKSLMKNHHVNRDKFDSVETMIDEPTEKEEG
ncbi:ribosome-associated translation inhibitor RaiA [Thiotrichales bacterium 19S11-10]|nr:ribosome-associated translation inhibitor RaiA [Thiotrichales bacterium 19S11-10]MCF6807580.1 ribosome-associated translation inhibitor RaiA [Thiotrichales bacterium 19S9-11]MCF6811549.1 ribosome-associated translation inhibitor RaiA [Thiotrichales bacterium 19S9-12]